MYALQRVYDSGPDRPELVLIHYTVCPEGSPGSALTRSSVVLRPEAGADRRQALLFLPELPGGRRVDLTYFFTAVRRGGEWVSPRYRTLIPDGETGANLVNVTEEGEGNLKPAPGKGTFRLVLPLRAGEPAAGTARFGFGAMRKKPSDALCRAAVSFGPGRPALIEAPEALSVLKNRPMPFFLYHLTEGGVGLLADKINNARITLKDGSGDVASVLLLWSESTWAAPNAAVMEAKNVPRPGPAAAEYYFAEDRAAYVAARMKALSGLPVPRTFEAFVYGPANSVVEYCYLVTRMRPDGSSFTEWRNRDGGNWRVTL